MHRKAVEELIELSAGASPVNGTAMVTWSTVIPSGFDILDSDVREVVQLTLSGSRLCMIPDYPDGHPMLRVKYNLDAADIYITIEEDDDKKEDQSVGKTKSIDAAIQKMANKHLRKWRITAGVELPDSYSLLDAVDSVVNDPEALLADRITLERMSTVDAPGVELDRTYIQAMENRLLGEKLAEGITKEFPTDSEN